METTATESEIKLLALEMEIQFGLKYNGTMELCGKVLHLFTDTNPESACFKTTLAIGSNISREAIVSKLRDTQAKFRKIPT